jgi:hypothetical protein
MKSPSKKNALLDEKMGPGGSVSISMQRSRANFTTRSRALAVGKNEL